MEAVTWPKEPSPFSGRGFPVTLRYLGQVAVDDLHEIRNQICRSLEAIGSEPVAQSGERAGQKDDHQVTEIGFDRERPILSGHEDALLVLRMTSGCLAQ